MGEIKERTKKIKESNPSDEERDKLIEEICERNKTKDDLGDILQQKEAFHDENHKYEEVIRGLSNLRKYDCPDSKMEILKDAVQMLRDLLGSKASLDDIFPTVLGVVLSASKTELVFSKQELQYILDFGFLGSSPEALIVTMLQAAVGQIELDMDNLKAHRRRRLFTGADLTAYFQKCRELQQEHRKRHGVSCP